jgi:hypothetical protein
VKASFGIDMHVLRINKKPASFPEAQSIAVAAQEEMSASRTSSSTGVSQRIPRRTTSLAPIIFSEFPYRIERSEGDIE